MLRVVVCALLAAVLLPDVSAAQAPLDDRRLRAWLQSDRGRAWMNTHHDAPGYTAQTTHRRRSS